MRLKFLHLARATYKYRSLKDSKEDDGEVFDIHKNRMFSRALSNMELGDTEDALTHSHRSTTAANKLDRSKRTRIEEQDIV